MEDFREFEEVNHDMSRVRYDYMINRIDSNLAALRSYWRFDEEQGDIIFDESLNNDGVIFGNTNRIISNAPYDQILNYGDLNNDYYIDILDVIIIISFILQNNIPNELETILSDLNNDGLINIIDIVVLVDIILYS